MVSRLEALRKTLDINECVFISSYPNIFYYSGFTSEDAYLLICHDRLVIITDSRYTSQAKLEAPDFEIYDISKGFELLFQSIKEEQIVYEEKHLSVYNYINIKNKCRNKNFVCGSDKISQFRRKKDAEEIQKIKNAEELADEAFSHILNFIKPGIKEIEIATELEYFMRKNGASKLSFDTIAASGVRSCMPHGVASEKEIKTGELLTLDFGCVLDGYCSDITRTVGIGSIGECEKEIYKTVLKAQETALLNMQTGMECANIDKLARDVITAAGYGENFGHSLGHSVGIEIHEAPNFSSKSQDIFENGNVITVEPGIYIDGFCGVRIEDVVAAYDNKIVNLTRSSKELIIL